MAERRVVITGIGVVSPFGVGRECFWEHIRSGSSGIKAVDAFDTTGYACRVAGSLGSLSVDDVPEVEGDSARDPEHRADPKRYSRPTHRLFP